MKILIAGGSGFIGTSLIRKLIASDHTVVSLTRQRGRIHPHHGLTVIHWDARSSGEWTRLLDGCDAVVNLAGENIGGKRWSESQKKKLVESRLKSTTAIVQAIGQAKKKPSVLVSASAVGFYGDVPEGDVFEDRAAGTDFLASLCAQWESEAMKARDSGVRVVAIRTGIVLEKSGGALQKMLVPFRLFAGGPLGSGRQWFPWIHFEDELRAIQFAIENSSLSGPVNLSAPNPVTMKDFCSALGRALHRPSWAPVPGFVLKIVVGEMAEPLLLGGQRALPKKLSLAGFQFKFDTVEAALGDILK